MPNQLNLIAVECTQCDWSLQFRPAQGLDADEAECPAQACPVCGCEATQVSFLHETDRWLSHLAAYLHWPEPTEPEGS